MPTEIPTTKEALESFGTSPGPNLGPGFGRRDPTATVGLRKSYARDMLSRLDEFLSIVRETVVENDALGIEELVERRTGITTNDKAAEEFAGIDLDTRFERFRIWAEQMSNRVVLDAKFDERDNVESRERWQDKYIVSAMAKAIRQADMKLAAAGVEIPEEQKADVDEFIMNSMRVNQQIQEEQIAESETTRRTIRPEAAEFPDVAGIESIGPSGRSEVIEGALASPEFAEPQMRRTLTQLARVNFNKFKTVSRDGVKELADTLKTEVAEGIARGENPRNIARIAFNEAQSRHQSVTRHRALTISRTEVTRAHAQSTLNRFQQFGVNAVQTQEWSTAEDERVCPICAAMNGQRFSVDEARGLIPAHVMGRCSWAPVTRFSEPIPEERIEESRERVEQSGIDPDKFNPKDHIDTQFNRDIIGLEGGSPAKPLSEAPSLDDAV